MSEAVGFLLFSLIEVMVSYGDRLVGNTGDVIESEGSLECCLHKRDLHQSCSFVKSLCKCLSNKTGFGKHIS